MIGKTLSHYRIVEKIGAGGMGEVYRARDEHLGRDVALKVLPAGTLGDEHARKRFRKEAQTLSKLSHPHIATVFDFDTQDGVDFLVMEHIPGITLSDKLQGGPLPEKEVTRLGMQLAEGLEAAHKEKVIHRDIKPGNLRVTPEGRLKVLDFGVAKLLRPVSATATTESFTETDSVAGTLPYMAPETIRDGTADHRSDIYATGVVLYELATGRRPFEEKTSGALTDAILHQAPPAPGRLKPDLSSRLEETILKALEKEPEDRYQSAKELLVDLRRVGKGTSTTAPAPWQVPRGSARWVWRVAGVVLAVVALVAVLVGLNVGGLRERLLGGVAPGQITSIAVLPLENMMGDAEQDYFVEGMHEALITELSKIGALKVISRTSAMRYKDTDKSVPEIARELGVDAVIEGSVLRAGNQVRITAQLIEAATDRHLWADNFDRELRNILALHSEVAQAIAREVKIAVTPEEETRLADARPVNPEAYEAYLKGRYHWNRRTSADLKKAVEYFRQAIENDSDFAVAYAGLADAYNLFEFYGVATSQDAFPLALAAANKALDLDDTLAEAHNALAFAKLMFDWDWSGAEREFKRAIELNPNYPNSHHWYALYLSLMGRHEEAIAEGKRALLLDPLSLIINSDLGAESYYFARQYDRAVAQLRKTLDMEPTFSAAHWQLGRAYEQKEMYQDAIEHLQEAIRLSNGSPLFQADLACIYAKAGLKDEARELLHKLERMSLGSIAPVAIAHIHASLGNKKRAFALLDEAFETRATELVVLKVEPRFDPLRDDPRFQSLLRRMNFPSR